MNRYQQLRRVLDENEEIFSAIYRHAMGGPVPQIIGFPVAAQHILASNTGRVTSKEFFSATQELRAGLGMSNQMEAEQGTKRPESILQRDVENSSMAIGSYVSRFVYLMESMS